MKKIIILLIILLVLFSCEYFSLKSYKEWLENTNGEDAIVYIAGYYDFGGGVQQACYWKIKDNDIDPVFLPGALNSRAHSIIVYEDNIYTCGIYNGGLACYWINDKFYELESSLPTPSRAWSINVHNGIVYVAGYYTSGVFTNACYWVNGKLYNIEQKGTSSEANSIFIEDNRSNDIYIAGYYNNVGNYSCYWKNGDLFDLPAAVNSRANSIFVINKDIYTAGYNGTDYGYWYNNNFITLQPVPSGNATASNSISLYNKDIYITGSAAGGPHAVYWKNNQPVELELNPVISDTNSICIYDSDVYVAGQFNSGPACYWKNGSRVDFNNGYAYSIFVARSKNVTQ